MRPSNLVPSFYFYKLADSLSGPYTALSAYSAGVIDAQGNILKPESSIDAFEYLVIKLKKIIDQLPYGMTKAQLGNYLSAIHYFSEAFEVFEITQEQFHCMMEGFVCQATNNEVSYLELLEDMSVGAGGGAPGSLGTPVANSQGPGVAGYDPKLGMPMQRRKQPKYFDNCEVFEVCPEEFIQFKAAKQWKDIPEGENKNYIQRFQRRNKNTKVAVKSLNPLNGEHEMHWISYPSPNFLGEGRGVKEFNDVASKILEPFTNEKLRKMASGSINQTDAEEYSRAAVFFSSLGNVNNRNADEFLTRTLKATGKKVADTTEDGVGLDDRGRVFTFNGKNHRATFGTRGVERIGFPQRIITDFYKLKQEKAETTSKREVKKLEQAMSGFRRKADVWAEPPGKQKAIRDLMIRHLEHLNEPVAAVTPWDSPLWIPSKGVIRHVGQQPVRVVLGLVGQGGRPEPQAQLGGSEFARSASGMEKLRKNIGTNPKHIIPDENDVQTSKVVLSTDIQNKFRHILGLK